MDGILVLATLFLLVGAGPLRLIEPSLAHLSFWCRIALAISLGWITFSIVLLSFGHFGAPVTAVTAAACAFVLIALSASVLWIVPAHVSTPKTGRRMLCVDAVATACIGLLFGYLAWINERMVSTPWDHFTYWLTDAKQIFATGYLRTDTRMTDFVPYSSYQPLQAVLLYLWYGELIEHHTSLLTILSAALASVLVYGSVRIDNTWQKLVVALLILVVNYTMVEYLFSIYADVMTAFMVALFFFILVNRNRTASARDISVRTACLLLILVALYYVKTTNRFYMPVMLLLWWWHDNAVGGWRQMMKVHLSVGSTAFLALLGFTVVSRVFYSQYLLVGELDPHNVMEAKDFVLEIGARVTYFDGLGNFVLSEFSLLLCSYMLVLGALVQKQRWTLTQLILVIAMIVFPAINFMHYAVGQYSLASRSLLRYMTAGVYLLPMMVAHWNHAETAVDEVAGKLRTAIAIVGTAACTVAMFASVVVLYPYAFHPRHSGRYADFKFLTERAQIAARVEKRTKGASVLLATDDSDHYVTNMDLESIKYRYFLSNNSVGGLYRVGKSYFHDFLLTVRPKYVFIQAFNDELAKYFPKELPNPTGYPVLYRVKRYDPFIATQVRY